MTRSANKAKQEGRCEWYSGSAEMGAAEQRNLGGRVFGEMQGRRDAGMQGRRDGGMQGCRAQDHQMWGGNDTPSPHGVT